MPTITTLVGVVVVIGFVLAGVLVVVSVLARLASRHEQSLTVDLDARRPRLQVSITPTRSRSADRPQVPDELSHSPGTDEKSS